MSARRRSIATPSASALAAAIASMPGALSTPTTSIPASAVGTATLPDPTPISSTGPPDVMASSTYQTMSSVTDTHHAS